MARCLISWPGTPPRLHDPPSPQLDDLSPCTYFGAGDPRYALDGYHRHKPFSRAALAPGSTEMSFSRSFEATFRLLLASTGLALVLLASPFAYGQPSVPVRVALVLGNSAYPAGAVGTALQDAGAIGKALRERGFTVIEAKDATLGQMRAALLQASAALGGRRGVGLLYYSGHGLQFQGRNYLIPVDATITSPADIAAQAMDVREVIDAFKSAGSRMNILILDACRDGPFGRYASGTGLAQLDAPPGTLLAFAAAPGTVVAEGTRGDLYALSLVEELKRPQLKLEDAFSGARVRVRRLSEGRQTPWESTSLEDNLFLEPNGQARLVATRQATATDEMTDWERSKGSIRDVRLFLMRHPNGLLGEVARLRLEQLEEDSGPRAEPMPEQFDAGATRFVGHFVKDPSGYSYSGNGLVFWPNGDAYDGDIVAGRREGKGLFVWFNGQRYRGEWKGDLPNGPGVLEFPDGARYEGPVVDGVPQGAGVYTWPNGQRLVGIWRDGEARGVADIRMPDGSLYHGDVSAGKPNGSGQLKFASGEQYVGSFKDGLAHGEGVYTWKNGDTYQGSWRLGAKEGPGVYTWANGDRWQGIYASDHQLEGELVRAGDKSLGPAHGQ
jgi:hypothetical protein